MEETEIKNHGVNQVVTDSTGSATVSKLGEFHSHYFACVSWQTYYIVGAFYLVTIPG